MLGSDHSTHLNGHQQAIGIPAGSRGSREEGRLTCLGPTTHWCWEVVEQVMRRRTEQVQTTPKRDWSGSRLTLSRKR